MTDANCGTLRYPVLPIFDSANASVIACCHTHMQFDRMIARTRVINAGSVGMPFRVPGADWILLGPDAQLRHTSYGLNGAAKLILHTDHPQADEFAERSILKLPSEQEMLEIFSKAELK